MQAKEQKAESTKFSGLQNETQFGVAKPEVHPHAHTGDTDHTNNTMFSCGSLAPKLKRGGGCMDHGFTRDKELWEMSDGTIFLLREIARVESQHPTVVKHLQSLSDLGYVDHFKHSHTLKENLFKSLAVILERIGKKKFRGYVELFLDPSFRAGKLEESQNLAVAAQELLLAMEKTYGSSIFKAILEGHDDRYISLFERFKSEAYKSQDFVYPAGGMRPPQSMGYGIGSGAGVVAGALNPSREGSDIAMTKAPWAK
mmetsp:Transcript_39540/g.60389  ORF Transcript_39540/g.60389 Transcript_39540/m.60389 type:complete len:256 (+) Transcript_39540:1576-2343(+)